MAFKSQVKQDRALNLSVNSMADQQSSKEVDETESESEDHYSSSDEEEEIDGEQDSPNGGNDYDLENI